MKLKRKEKMKERGREGGGGEGESIAGIGCVKDLTKGIECVSYCL